MKTENITASWNEWYRMKENKLAHLAGAFDIAGTVTVRVSKESDYSIGYSYQPIINIYRPKDVQDPIMGKVTEYCDEQVVKYTITEQSQGDGTETTSYTWVCKDRDSIEAFLEPLLPHLVTNYRPAMIMLETILPKVREGQHTSKEGFYELMGILDRLRPEHHGSKYTQEYFAEEWSLSK